MMKHLRYGGILLLLLLLCCTSVMAEDDLLAMDETEEYESYLARYTSLASPKETCTLQAADYAGWEGGEPEQLTDWEGQTGVSILQAEQSSLTWTVDVAQEGLYAVYVEYHMVEGRGKDVKRTLLLDGEVPCDAARSMLLRRVYVNAEDTLRQDAQGNDMRPAQVERRTWRTEALEDSRGYAMAPLQLYFSEGSHTLTLRADSEPLVLHSITLKAWKAPDSYEMVAAAYQEKGYAPGASAARVEAEDATAKSSPMLYARNDRSDVSVSPSDHRLKKVNTIGGSSWNMSGQWLEWTVEAPSDGLYTLTLHARQDFVRGLPVLRKLTIDGETPFLEAEQLRFYYHGGYQWVSLGYEEGEPYSFYLTQGTHTLRLTAVLGDAAQSIREVETTVNNINRIYRQVVMITGAEPDPYRDYQLGVKLPELSNWLLTERDRLQSVLDSFEALGGTLGEREAPLKTMVNRLERYGADVERMISSLRDFLSAISSVGTWLTQAAENPLQLDVLLLTPAGQTPETPTASLLDKAWYEVKSLAASYTIDYNAMGAANGDAEESITVWIATGRDQANIVKAMADEEFTAMSGVNVELAMVDVNALLPAILSGQGPDVAMLIGGNLPINYAMRGAVTDLTQFEDFEQVAARFHPEAMVPFNFRDGCYALPENLTFPMLFYRKDILAEIGLPVPRTWDEVKAAISVLSKNSMYFGLGSLTVTGQATLNVLTPYAMLLYQRGGSFYTEDGISSALDEPQGIEAFKELTKLYSDYTLESDYDFVNLFRTGLMPLGIVDMSAFNTLQVFAPELDGMWGFTTIPGLAQADGTVDNTAPCGGQAIVIMENSDHKDAAWEYLKWWTDADTQVRYGRELESLMGAAARYPTANQEAFVRLPWDEQDLARLLKQYGAIRGVPEVPGGYYTPRCLGNAFYDVVVEKSIGAREALIDQVAIINAEIDNKREEFGINSTEEDQP